MIDQVSKHYQNETLGHLSTYQWLIIDKNYIVACHKLIITKSFVRKRIFITTKDWFHNASIYFCLHDFFGINGCVHWFYGANVNLCWYIVWWHFIVYHSFFSSCTKLKTPWEWQITTTCFRAHLSNNNPISNLPLLFLPSCKNKCIYFLQFFICA